MPQRIVLTLTCPECDGTAEVSFPPDEAVRVANTLGSNARMQCPTCRDHRQKLGKGRVQREFTPAELRDFLAG